ncbi:hypothetical protein BGX23_001710 [Mortierella sp. AD031]|nr:hypothetical protein BGX23_001710 [Mortierella sp. AD031]KAG0205400.1 hypothetical protein BGX33_007918 [Mortierella sp. NVP41]
MASQWQAPATPPPDELNSIPIPLSLIPPTATPPHPSESDHTLSARSTLDLANKIATTQTWSHPSDTPSGIATTTTTVKSAADQNRNQQSSATTTTVTAPPLSPGAAPTYPRALGPDTTSTNRNRAATSTTGTSGQQQQQAGGSSSPSAGHPTDVRPTGTPRIIVRIDRDHNIGDEATRFECEQFPEEFLGRVTRVEFKGTVEGINRCMEVAEETLWNCFDTLLDCLSAYTAKHCCGTHYQRSIRKMEAFIQEENRRVYHPARMHLRDPQKVGMIYLEFELF